MMKMMKIIVLCVTALGLFSLSAWAVIPMPVRLGGTVTVDGKPLAQATASGFSFKVTFQDGSPLLPVAESSGLNTSNMYLVNIPVYDGADQPGGAKPGVSLLIHLYHNGAELALDYPRNNAFLLGESGSVQPLDLVAATQSSHIIIVLGDNDPMFTVPASSPCLVYGTKGFNEINLEKGAVVKCINFPGNNRIRFNADAGEVSVAADGSYVIFQDMEGTRLEIPASRDLQTLVFDQGSLTLYISYITVYNTHRIVLQGSGVQYIGTTPRRIDTGILR